MSPRLIIISICAGLLTVFVGEYLLNNPWVFLLMLGVSLIPIMKVADIEYKKEEQRKRFAAWERLKAMSSPASLEAMKKSGFYDDMENEMRQWRESNG